MGVVIYGFPKVLSIDNIGVVSVFSSFETKKRFTFHVSAPKKIIGDGGERIEVDIQIPYKNAILYFIIGIVFPVGSQ